ncbi:MAG: SDR family oxidoreductase, partial [Ardenticatenaceae bacterium]
MSNLRGKTIFITGGSRGIGKAIGLRAARDGANIVIAAKTTQPHPKLPGTIYTAAEEMRAAGGEGLACMVDIRSEELVQAAIDKAVETFGGIDILINNASAISLTGTQHTKMKRFDLMHEVNTRGTFMTSKLCIPHLKKADNPHVLNLSPPLNMTPHWFAPYVAYTMAKYGMSMCVLGMAQEFKKQGIAFNALWPKTTIATAAIKFIVGGEAMMAKSRTPQIVADAAYAILTRNSRHCTGNFFIDEDVLREEGETNFSQYQVNPDLDQSKLMPD